MTRLRPRLLPDVGQSRWRREGTVQSGLYSYVSYKNMVNRKLLSNGARPNQCPRRSVNSPDTNINAGQPLSVTEAPKVDEDPAMNNHSLCIVSPSPDFDDDAH